MNSNRLPFHLKRKLLAILLVCCLVTLMGCGDQKGALELAKTGGATAKTLGDFYDTLAQDTLDYWEILTFESAIRGFSLSASDQSLYQGRLKALNSRARMARSLEGTYGALSRLASYDASGEVKSAATGGMEGTSGLSFPHAGCIYGSVS